MWKRKDLDEVWHIGVEQFSFYNKLIDKINNNAKTAAEKLVEYVHITQKN